MDENLIQLLSKRLKIFFSDDWLKFKTKEQNRIKWSEKAEIDGDIKVLNSYILGV